MIRPDILNLRSDPIVRFLPWPLSMGILFLALSFLVFLALLRLDVQLEHRWAQITDAVWWSQKKPLQEHEGLILVPWHFGSIAGQPDLFGEEGQSLVTRQQARARQKERVSRIIDLVILNPELSAAKLLSREEQLALLPEGTERSLASDLPLPSMIHLSLDPNIDDQSIGLIETQLLREVPGIQFILFQAEQQHDERQVNRTSLLLIAMSLTCLAFASMLMSTFTLVRFFFQHQNETLQTLLQLGANKNFLMKAFKDLLKTLFLRSFVTLFLVVLVLVLLLWFGLVTPEQKELMRLDFGTYLFVWLFPPQFPDGFGFSAQAWVFICLSLPWAFLMTLPCCFVASWLGIRLAFQKHFQRLERFSKP